MILSLNTLYLSLLTIFYNMNRESFSKPFTKEQIHKEIETSVQDYLRKKLERIGDEREIISYNTEKAETPISRDEFEKEINNFIENNFSVFVSLSINNKGGDELNKFKVLNKDLRDFGFGDTSVRVEAVLKDNGNYYQDVSKREEDNFNAYLDELTISDLKKFDYDMLGKYKMRLRYPSVGEKYNKFKELADVLATAYLKEHVRVDSKLETGDRNSEHTQRYFYRDFGRYLCENDFGMKPYNENADVSDITPFAQTVQRQIRKILSNVEAVRNAVLGDQDSWDVWDYQDEPYFRDFKEELEQKYEKPEKLDDDHPNINENNLERQRVDFIIIDEISKEKNRIDEEKLSEALNSPDVKSLVLNAVPFAKFANEIGSRRNEEIETFINENIGEELDLYKRLEYLESKKFQDVIKDLILRDSYTLPELGDKVIAISVAHEKPVILENDERIQYILSNAGNSYIEKTKREIINSDPDEQLKRVSLAVSSGRGDGSPYSFHPFDFYQSLRKVGVDKFLELYPQAKENIVKKNQPYYDLSMNEFIYGINEIHKIFGDKIHQMEVDKIKKEIWHEKALKDANVWTYFAERGTGLKDPKLHGFHGNETAEEMQKMRDEAEQYYSKTKIFLQNLSQPERKKLFFEGKQIYWLAKQVQKKIWELDKNKNIQVHGEWTADDEEKNEFKFHYYHNNINWETYDYKNVDLEKLYQYLGSHGNIICTLLANKNESGQVGSNVNLETIMQAVEAMEAGADMRGAALAFDKKKYLDGIISGQEQKNDLEYALKDWPSKLRDSVSLEEFQMYFENAEQYLYQDPNGMLRYAELLQNEPRIRELLGGEVEKKSDLDFRLCLTVQNPDVRNWYFEGAEYIGHNALQKYFVRFNATQEQTGGYPNLHDALYWIPNIKRVESGEARALLDVVNTVDESNDLCNLLARYDKEQDNLIKDGQIKSLRELKKRVFAIESNMNLTDLTPEILDIISAPGFDLTKLKRFQEEPRFKELVEGKLDKEQSFLPHKRMFTARPLTELLKDGLGSFKEKIKGTAQDPKGLFNDVRRLMQDKEINGKQMQIQDLLREVPLDMEEDILKLLQDQRVATGALLEATVHAKSDPDGWVCGNYTDCCMPFGDPKNTDYMFNKGTQYFTVKYNDRIIAQSVIVNSTNRKNKESVIILDNIEIANNYKNQAPILSRIYKTFWAEYTSLPVKIGTGHSDLIPDSAVLVSNIYSPKHSLSYSDATGSNIYDLPKIKGVESIDKILTFANLSERDAETIAEMEKTAYPEGMVQGKGEVLEVIRKSREMDLPGAASSFILRQGNEPAGYLLVLPEESKLNSGETVAHIYDMVVLPKFQGGTIARKMMERMLDTAKAYDVPAIEFEARESTSYRLITNPRIQKWIESKGYKLSYNELLPSYLNGENFYYVRLEKINTQE